MRRAVIPALLLAFPAAAGSISGTIRNPAGTGLPGMEVRLWSCAIPAGGGCKTWSITSTILPNAADGSYQFLGIGGNHLIDARPGPSVGTQYTDRWYAA